MAATFSPSPAELALTQQIFAHADPQKLGALTGEVAVKVFGAANLSPIVLGEVWQIADESNNGWLSQKGVAMAVRLMGHVQKGEKVSAALLSKRTHQQAFPSGCLRLLQRALSPPSPG